MEGVRKQIEALEGEFNKLKIATIQCLERFCISVACVVYIFTSLYADDLGEHKIFLNQYLSTLYRSNNHWEVFGSLNLNYWNYLAYHLLDHLIVELSRNDQLHKDAEGMEQTLIGIKHEIELYKIKLKQFRERTPLQIFCQAQKEKIDKPPQSFETIVVKHNWKGRISTATLEHVEEFRQCYLRCYNLRDCAMMLNSIRPGTFTITWFVPMSLIKNLLKKKRLINVLKEFSVIRLEVAESCIYEDTIPYHVSL